MRAVILVEEARMTTTISPLGQAVNQTRDNHTGH